MILQWIKRWLFKKKVLFYIGRHDVLKAPLKGKEEADALVKLQQGDAQARDLLIEHVLLFMLLKSMILFKMGVLKI